jgi:hypothetical protein
MLKASSALASAKPYVSTQLKIAEAPDFSVVQYSGSEKDLKKAFGKLPAYGVFANELFRISPTQMLQLGRHSRESGNPTSSSVSKLDSRLRGNDETIGMGNDRSGVHVTELSSSRTRIEISGAPARDLLAKCAAIDFHTMKPNAFVMTGIHHVPVLIHCVDAATFHLYVMRTFALSIWDYITDAAVEYS